MNTYAATASTAHSSGKTVAKAVALFAVGILLVVMGAALATAIPAIAEGVIGMTSIVLLSAVAVTTYASLVFAEMNR
ncbi:hypothetical protein [Bifidobacterium breve]|uniref:hypothetical protein n=1 Tax=Bifidobacterium breve TaxID=1685 RepID=UPI00189A1FCB|nr:hypothetical protein [Bifidobacterium breve]